MVPSRARWTSRCAFPPRGPASAGPPVDTVSSNVRGRSGPAPQTGEGCSMRIAAPGAPSGRNQSPPNAASPNTAIPTHHQHQEEDSRAADVGTGCHARVGGLTSESLPTNCAARPRPYRTRVPYGDGASCSARATPSKRSVPTLLAESGARGTRGSRSFYRKHGREELPSLDAPSRSGARRTSSTSSGDSRPIDTAR